MGRLRRCDTKTGMSGREGVLAAEWLTVVELKFACGFGSGGWNQLLDALLNYFFCGRYW